MASYSKIVDLYSFVVCCVLRMQFIYQRNFM